ncbi:hypothetical protein BVG16_02970 [Paenibacillus selenitireducens]|uniref:Histone n=1 Tax=Paenibacillus selenitireducens TaxID=1324314 RepID=A0A1T2XN49_9BACL|nr:hypothetical protein [Paenibacillus selenitireducens]OPA81294.1 hypothetical protein BVG16_02970 [Paenibacillus selenitireducens]
MKRLKKTLITLITAALMVVSAGTAAFAADAKTDPVKKAETKVVAKANTSANKTVITKQVPQKKAAPKNLTKVAKVTPKKTKKTAKVTAKHKIHKKHKVHHIAKKKKVAKKVTAAKPAAKSTKTTAKK